MLCPKCGTANPDSSEFCTNCGQALSNGAAMPHLQFNESKWGEDTVPDWMLDLQENLSEELRDPDLDQMVRQRAIASVQPVAPPITEGDDATSVRETEVTPEVQADSAEWLETALSPIGEDTPPLEEEPSISQEVATESEAWLGTLLSSAEDGSDEAIVASQDTETGTPAGTTASQAPDWLDDLRSSIDEDTVQQETGAQPTGDREMPDWLQQESFSVEPGEPEAIPSATSEIEVLPQIQKPTPSVEEQAVPDWRQATQPSHEQEEEALGTPETGQPAELPDWLQGITEPYAQTTEEMSLVDDAVPDWLRTEREEEPGLHAETPSATTETGEAESSVVDADTPEWLLALEEDGTPLEADDVPVDLDDTVYTETELPDWLRDTEEAHPSPEEDLQGQQIVEEEIAEEATTEPAETVSAAAGLAGVAALEKQPSGDEGEIPEWIQGLAEQTPEEPLPPAKEDEASLLESTEVGGPVPLSHITPGEAPVDASEMPEWLRELRDQEPLEDMEPPIWLTEPETEIQAELPAEEIPQFQEETPGWLAGLPSVEQDSPAEDVPEWLRDLDTTEEELSQEIPESEEGEVPSWLKRMSEPETTDESAETSHAEEVGILEESDELSEAQPPPSDQPTAGAPIPPLPPESPLPDAAPTEAMDSISEREVATASTTDESPQGLQVKESAILAGIGAALSVEPAISAVTPRQELISQAIPEETEQARIFQEIASQPPVPRASAIGRKRSRLWGTLGRIIIYLLIIATVVITLYWQGALEIGFFSRHNLPISRQTQNVYEQINTIPEQSLALLVVDYEPSLAEELNAQARTLLQNLMQRQLKILMVSTTLTGPQVVQDIMEELAGQPEFNYEYGEDYINLGYLPGQEASLSLFGRSPLAAVRVDFRDGQDLSSYPVAAGLQDVPQKGLGQVIPLVVNLSGNQDNLRIWIEQVLAANDNVNMIMGVSAGLEPYVYPYLESGQLAGVLSGLTGAAEYEALTGKPGRAIRSIDSQVAVHLLIVGLIVLGNVGYALKRVVRRR